MNARRTSFSGTTRMCAKRFGLMGMVLCVLIISVFAVFLVGVLGAKAEPITDTSSPQATLRTLLENIDAFMELSLDGDVSYAESERWYRDEREKRLTEEARQHFVVAIQTLDLSRLPSGFRRVLAIEQLVRLADVLARVDIPPLAEVPDGKAMIAADLTKWSIPGSNIEIALVEEGPRAGEYLISARTVANLEHIHQRVVHRDPRPGPTKTYLDGLSAYTSDRTLYDLWRNSAATFGVLPERWSLAMPDWLKAHFLGATLWQWLVVALCELLALLSIWIMWRGSAKFGASLQARTLMLAIVLVGYSALAPVILETLQISGTLLFLFSLASVILLYAAAIWTAFATANIAAEIVIKRQSLRAGGVDSQLVRLGARLLALALSCLLVIKGTGDVGFPAYSLLTGLGVSGLAVALAARDTLSNLLGSISIMFEKPFRSQDWIKVGETEGTVEFVGFRSTRIRTAEDSVVSIPNNLLVNSTVDNLGARTHRRQEFKIEVPRDTPRNDLRAFVQAVRRFIEENPRILADDRNVYLNSFREVGLGLLIQFHLCVRTFEEELQEREEVMFGVLDIADRFGIKIGVSA